MVYLYINMSSSHNLILPKYLIIVKEKGSSLLCAHGWAGQTQLPYWRRISQSEIRNSAAAEKSESESEGGQKFLPPNPLPFCPPERSVSAVPPAAGAISRSFVQNRFELRSAIATNQDISNFHGKEQQNASEFSKCLNWSGCWESNPGRTLPKRAYYHYTTPRLLE